MAKSADAFRTISEVADWLETPAHVLRFWESKFSQVKPVKRAGGRRYYRPADMKLLGGIKQLLHEDGLTIKGVQKILREQGVKHVARLSQPLDELTEAEAQDITLDVVEDTAPDTAEVLNFRKEPDKPAPAPTPVDTGSDAAQDPDTDAGADAEPEGAETADAQADKPQAEAVETHAQDNQAEPDEETADAEVLPESDAAAPPLAQAPQGTDDTEAPADDAPSTDTQPPTDTPEAAPAMPSFMQRRPEPQTPSEAEPDDVSADTEASEDAPALIIPSIPDLPDDPSDDMDAPPGPLTALAKITGPVSADALAHLNELAAQLGSSDVHSDS